MDSPVSERTKINFNLLCVNEIICLTKSVLDQTNQTATKWGRAPFRAT